MVNREDVFKSLDLHGYKHDEIEKEVVNFVFTNELPVLIITGFSGPMAAIVKRILDKHDFVYHPQYWTNEGCLVIMEKS
jgi:hypothetical protein|tara:strand:+ start:150 stop:386 length:237 start_codon:yes stop_codon:yes gene_type:complete